MDVILAIPSLLLAILVVAMLGPSLRNTIIAIAAVYLPNYVRVVRASALSEKTRDYVTSARVAGHAVLEMTSNSYYSLRGVHPGARFAAVAGRL